MPHSSGGGSSSGGSHSGSHGSSSRRLSRYYFHGSHRYVRYKKNGSMEFFFCDRDIAHKSTGINWFGLILILIFMFFSGTILYEGFYPPEKIDTSSYESFIYISDGCNAIRDVDRLGSKLNEFQDLTGISVCIETLYDSEWRDEHGTLEDYAYDEYIASFDDELHWLIVYSKNDVSTKKKDEWKFEGMQGDNTDYLLTETDTGNFNKIVQKSLKDGKSFDEAVIAGLDKIGPNMMKGPQWDMIFGALLLICMLGYAAYATCLKDRIGNASGYIRVEDDEKKLRKIKCPKCGTFYIKGSVPCCPSCFNLKWYKINPFYRKKVDEELSNYPVYEVDNDDNDVF